MFKLSSLTLVLILCVPFILAMQQQGASSTGGRAPEATSHIRERLWAPYPLRFHQAQWIFCNIYNQQPQPIRLGQENDRPWASRSGGLNTGLSLSHPCRVAYDPPDPLLGYIGERYPLDKDVIFTASMGSGTINQYSRYHWPSIRPDFELLHGEGFGYFNRVLPNWLPQSAIGDAYISCSVSEFVEAIYLQEGEMVAPNEPIPWDESQAPMGVMTYWCDRLKIEDRPRGNMHPDQREEWDWYVSSPRTDNTTATTGAGMAWLGPKPIDCDKELALWVQPNPEHQAGEDLDVTYIVHNIHDRPVWIWPNDLVPAQVDWTLRLAHDRESLENTEDLENENIIAEIEQPNADVLVSLLPKRDAFYLMPGECLTFATTLTDDQLGGLRARRNHRLQATLSLHWLPARQHEMYVGQWQAPEIVDRPDKSEAAQMTIAGAWLVRPE